MANDREESMSKKKQKKNLSPKFVALSLMQNFLGTPCQLVHIKQYARVCKHWEDNLPLQVLVEKCHGYVNVSDFFHCTRAFYPIQSQRAFIEWFQEDGLTLMEIHGGDDVHPIVATPSLENVVDFWFSPLMFKHYIYSQGNKPWLALVQDIIRSVQEKPPC
jgi:hypothetical protein